jgi:class 3 adenylate cyclase/CHASE2 domain-containing sensor protein
MAKFSKESKYTFFALLIIPIIWISLNHLGYLDYLKVKSVDLRKQYRGEIPQNFQENALDRIQVEENKTVPRIPKLIYVNFDEATMARDEVGERPWDRAFFRDTCIKLFEKAGVRAIGFDFGFTPKSTSRMVPLENSYRSDKALGELIKKYPDRVVLGCLYSGVKTPYVKEIEANAQPPLFSDGFSVNEDNFHYPESSSYPIINYLVDKYFGRMGSFSFLPYRSVDDVKRWATLWYPAGGKAHAYNLLGGKKRFLKLDFIHQKGELLKELNNNQVDLDELKMVLNNFQLRLEEYRDTPILRQNIEAQIQSRLDDKKFLDNKITKLEERTAFLANLSEFAETELVEANNSLQLVYSNSGEGFLKGQLVDTFPNKVPLFRDEPIFTLAVETLLAYYGVDHEQVKISEDNSLLTICSLDGSVLIEAPLEDGQWVEVNYFSTWTEFSHVDELIRSAKKKYGSGDMLGYLNLVPSVIRQTLQQVDGLKPSEDDEGLLEDIRELGVEDDLIVIAQKLFAASKSGTKGIPSFNELLKLLRGIDYYFIPTSLNSKFNPMCGMNNILDYGAFEVEVSAKIKELKEAIKKGESKLSQVNSALLEDPENEDYLSFRNKVTLLNQNNKSLLIQQEEELARIDSFFEVFKDSIVLIGPTDPTFKDVAPTPFDKFPVPSVSAHGNTIKTLTHQKFLHRLPINTDHLATLGVCVLMALLAVYQGKRASLVQAAGIILLGGYIYFGFEAFAQSHVVWPITAPACAGLSTSFIGLAAMVVIEQKAKGRLKGMFGSYVSSDLVEQMVASGEEPSLGGEETEITAFFSDVQAFSSFSELLTPTGLVDLMNEYLTAMTNILQEERGTLDKYIGDAIVAMYGAPIPMKDHAYQAVRTSILMQQKQIELRNKWVPEVEKWGKCHSLVTQMQTRIGCNTGTATVGNMGALDRFNYTMMGDMVNLAARCESGAKAYGAYIMVTEETKLASEKMKDDIAFRYLDKIVVKGRSQPVAMYEPTGFMSELTQETQDCLDCFQQGIDKYLAQDWMGALNLFEKAKEMEPNKPGVTPGVKDNPSMILIDRCKVMMDNPPGDDWDGVYVMTTK